MKLIKTMLFLALVAFNPVHAEEKAEPNPFYLFLFGEVMIATNAWMAAEDPHTYGAIGVLGFPIAGCNVKYCLDLAAFEALALYNLSIDPDKMPKSEIFEKNVIAWHLAVGFSMISHSIFEDKSYKLNLVPKFDGLGVQFEFNF